jgi:Cys-tRNA(Pro)/Cys-tRNA(Cys) deacylase
MAMVNNVTRMLDAQGIGYAAFELPEDKLSALDTAQRLDADPDCVFKTIVITRSNRSNPLLVLVPASSEVDLKGVAAAIHEKKVHLPTEREAERLTGLQAGGISPLALIHRGFMVLIDVSAVGKNEIHISGGQRGLNIRLSVEDLVRITRARAVPVCTSSLGSAAR